MANRVTTKKVVEKKASKKVNFFSIVVIVLLVLGYAFFEVIKDSRPELVPYLFWFGTGILVGGIFTISLVYFEKKRISKQ
jgi:hypothetical protein